MSNGDSHLVPNDFSYSEKTPDINLIYEVKEEFDNEGNWKGYRIGVIDNLKQRGLRPIQKYDVPVKYDENKELDKNKSNNGLQ